MAERREDPADSLIVLRAMRDDDVPAIMAVEERSYPFPWTAGIFHDCMRAGYSCHVIEKDGRLAGYGVMSAAAREAHILNVCVAPEQRGQGYGRMLMERMIAQARRLHAEMMFLEVRPSNQVALRLYTQLGFNEIGTRNNYYPAERGREDALLLAKQL